MSDANIVFETESAYTDAEITEARHKLWRMGCLEWKFSVTQKKIYDFFNGKYNKTIVVNASRRLGKSYGLAILAIEDCLKRDGIIVKFLQPEAKMIRQNILPIFDEIFSDCPKDLLPVYSTQDSTYKFQNGSKIQFAGTDNKNYEKLRGGQCHLAIIDEAGFCTDLRHIIKYILTPTTMRTKGRIILSSTTPTQPDHEFTDYMISAEESGRLIRKTIYDARDDDKFADYEHKITDEMIADIIKDLPNGEDDESFRTEYLCELIFNSNDSVIPEFTKLVQTDTVVPWSRPVFCDKYVSMDIGFKDLTFIIFGYYDFEYAVFVIEDEIALSGQQVSAKNISALVKQKEDEIWVDKLSGETMSPYMRVADNNLILLNDLRGYGVHFNATDKHNKEAFINKLKTWIQDRRIIINPKCVQLISHLKHATWDKSRKEFKQAPKEQGGHHYDGVDALAYLIRNLIEGRNPYPPGYSHSRLGRRSDYFISPNQMSSTGNVNYDQLNNMFKPKSSFRRNGRNNK